LYCDADVAVVELCNMSGVISASNNTNNIICISNNETIKICSSCKQYSTDSTDSEYRLENTAIFMMSRRS